VSGAASWCVSSLIRISLDREGRVHLSLIEVCLSLADVSCHRIRVQQRGDKSLCGKRETSGPVAICEVEMAMAMPVLLKQTLQMKNGLRQILDCQPHARGVLCLIGKGP
jgi:hypothetical protein